MLDPKPRIAARRFLLQTLKDRQHAVNREVAVRVHTYLPTGQLRLASRVVEIFRRGSSAGP